MPPRPKPEALASVSSVSAASPVPAVPGRAERVFLYDTTLRDGAQTRGVDFTPSDKMHIAHALDELGVDYVEGGWPGANPGDDAFFADPPELRHARLVVFGMTRRGGRSADNDMGLRALLAAPVPVACLVGKSSAYQVDTILKVSHAENRRMIQESIARIKRDKDEVLFDAEHFFDGFKANPDFSLSCLEAALAGGADWLVLCDTNGGTLPVEVQEIVSAVKAALPEASFGIHLHNDTETAVAGSLAALDAGARQIQGTINGLGERCGNANLIPLVASLTLKTEWKIRIDEKGLRNLRSISHMLDERLNRTPPPGAAYVGSSAFAHKGGLHAAAVVKDPRSYEHIEPERVGNRREILVSSQAGRANVLARLQRIGIAVDADSPELPRLVECIKKREAEGYSYESADASLFLLVNTELTRTAYPFRIERFRTINERRKNARGELVTESEATVTLTVGEQETMTVAIGHHGPVDALNQALRKALVEKFPALARVRLVDYKVRILNSNAGTEAKTRVLIDWTDDTRVWSTVGLSHNVLDASFEAIVDAVAWRLQAVKEDKAQSKPNPKPNPSPPKTPATKARARKQASEKPRASARTR